MDTKKLESVPTVVNDEQVVNQLWTRISSHVCNAIEEVREFLPSGYHKTQALKDLMKAHKHMEASLKVWKERK